MSMVARGLSVCRRCVSQRDGGGVGEIGLRHDQAVGEDDLLARFRRLTERRLAVDRVDHRQHHVDVKLAAQRAIGGEGLQDRRRIGQPRGLDQDAGERRHRAALAIEHELTQRLLQIGAGDAAQAAVADEHGLLGGVAHQRVVDADGAEFVDDDGGAGAFGRLQKAADQRRLAGAEKAGDDGHRNLGAALAFEPAPERACLARGEQVEHGFTSPARGERSSERSERG